MNEDLPEDIAEVLNALGDRMAAEPNLTDFLLWVGGTLEYWIHILFSQVGNERGWACRSEVPYITGAPAPTSKTGVKWADGALVLPSGRAVLLEVKTVPVRTSLGAAVKKVPGDLSALVAIDWAPTMLFQPDLYCHPDWVTRRSEIAEVWALQLALVHGPGDSAIDITLDAELNAGLAPVRARHGHEPWFPALVSALQAEPHTYDIRASGASAQLLAWAVPIVDRATVSAAPASTISSQTFEGGPPKKKVSPSGTVRSAEAIAESNFEALLASASPATRYFDERAVEWARVNPVRVTSHTKTKSFSQRGVKLFAIYPKDDCVGFYLGGVAQPLAAELHAWFQRISTKRVTATEPYLRCSDLVDHWEEFVELLPTYVAALLDRG